MYPAALFAVPVIGVTAVNATKHSSPGFAAIAELDWLALAPVVGLFWSVWNSYRGVRVVCHRRPFMAALMFLTCAGGMFGT